MSLPHPIQSCKTIAQAEAGQTLVEYALILTFVAIALVVSLQLFSVGLTGTYDGFVQVFADLT